MLRKLLADVRKQFEPRSAPAPEHALARAESLLAAAKSAHESGDTARAAGLIEEALRHAPDNAVYHNICGEMYRKLGHHERAVPHYRAAIALDPRYPHPHFNLGVSLQERIEHAAAIEALEEAIRLEPDDPEAHIALSFSLLALGDYARGWREYGWRRRHPAVAATLPRLTQPAWNGEALDGTILLYAEQGYGDAIHFARYVPWVAERVSRVIVKCYDPVVELFGSLGGRPEVIGAAAPVAHYDVHAALLDLPAIFGSTLETLPRAVPYLRAPQDRVEEWRQRLGDARGKLRVGIAWAGSPLQGNDRNRSTTLASFAALARVKDAVFYSLQKDGGERDRTWPQGAAELVDLAPSIRDFSDTAAIVEQLDLVVSVDTSLAHLAGALGRPVWTALTYAPCWRYLTVREDSPWYPTMRLFRQPRSGAWPDVFAQIAAALEREVALRG